MCYNCHTMQTVTVGSKYQVVIPKEVRKKIKGIMPGSKVKISAEGNQTVKIQTQKKNWSDQNYGAFRKYWKGIDPIAEVEKMRNEWDEKS